MQPEQQRFKDLLRHYAQQRPRQLALRDAQVGFDYAELLEQVEHREALLREWPGEVFALAMGNGPDAVLWDLAALLSGLPCVILPGFFTASQRAHCLNQSQASLAVADPDMAEELRAAGFERVGRFWRRPCGSARQTPPGTAKITYTSGTTGQPKGVCLSGEALLRVARELADASQPTRPQRYLAVLPLAVLLENLGLYAALMAGASLDLPTQQELGISGATGVDWPRLLGYLANSGAQSMILVPQLLLGLVTAIERGAISAPALRFVAVGGARVSPDLLQRAARVGVPVFEGYGLSECASVVSLNRPGAMRIGSVGKPLPHVRVTLADDGEVLVAGSHLLGYLGEAPFTGQWWPTGDIGEFDADGFLYLKGRKKHQFVTSFGRNVNPEWVEAELTHLGSIAQAFVYGEGLSRNLALIWPLDADCSDASLDAAIAQANAALPDYARVAAWQRLPEPFSSANGMLTSNGRLRRDAIVSHYRQHLSQLVSE